MVEIIYGGGSRGGKSLAMQLARAVQAQQKPKRQRAKVWLDEPAPIPSYRPHQGRRVLADLTFYSRQPANPVD